MASPCMSDLSDMELCMSSDSEQSSDDYEYSDMELCSSSDSEQSSDDYDYSDDDDDVDAGLGLIEDRPPLGLEDYIHDILDTYRRTENLRRPAAEYLATQKELDEVMRWKLSDWMIRRHHTLLLRPETLYLAFYVMDMYLSLQSVAAVELLPVAASSLFLASKYHEREGYRALDFAGFSRSIEASMIEKEKDILQKLKWNLSAPTPYEFLSMFLKAGGDLDEEMQFAAFFFGELGLMDYSEVGRPPSLRAASALYAARCTLGRTPLWPHELMQETKYTELHLLETAESLVRLHSMVKSLEGNKPKAVYEKYAAGDRKAVALLPPATLVMEKRKAAFSSVYGALQRFSMRVCLGRRYMSES